MPRVKRIGFKERKAADMKLKRAKAMVEKERKGKAKKNMDTFFFKSKVTAAIIPTQGTFVSNYVYNSFSLDPSGGSAAYNNNAEFQLYRSMYDKFRVNSVRVTFTPKANVLDQANNNNDTSLNTTGDGMVHHVVDRDSVAPSNIARLTRYPSYRKTSVLKKFSRTYSVKYPMGVWIDCDAPSQFSMIRELGLQGGVTIYAENILEDSGEVYNEPWASVLVEHNIVFQGKTQGKLAGVYDPVTNELTGVTSVFTSTDPNLTESTLRNIRGTLDADKRLTDTAVAITEVAITDSGTA
jgi:hypothetical protein